MKFPQRRELALAILNRGEGITPKAAAFLGQCTIDQNPLTERQQAWFEKLVERFEQPKEGPA